MGNGVLGNNVSEKYRFQWVAPERTGSRKVAEILSYYGFKNNNTNLYDFGTYKYTHKTIIDDRYSDYKVICNARNPYGRVYSLFKNFYSRIQDKNKEGFRRYVTDDLLRGQTLEMAVDPKWDRPFDYVIRLEHMKEDLMKLPFINDVLTESQLDLMTSHGKEIDSWEEFYDDEMKEIVYGLTSHHFKLWGYEK